MLQQWFAQISNLPPFNNTNLSLLTTLVCYNGDKRFEGEGPRFCTARLNDRLTTQPLIRFTKLKPIKFFVLQLSSFPSSTRLKHSFHLRDIRPLASEVWGVQSTLSIPRKRVWLLVLARHTSIRGLASPSVLSPFIPPSSSTLLSMSNDVDGNHSFFLQ